MIFNIPRKHLVCRVDHRLLDRMQPEQERGRYLFHLCRRTWNLHRHRNMGLLTVAWTFLRTVFQEQSKMIGFILRFCLKCHPMDTFGLFTRIIGQMMKFRRTTIPCMFRARDNIFRMLYNCAIL